MSHRRIEGGRQEGGTSEPRRFNSAQPPSSPDPVHLVRQYEEDERLARQLQEHETLSPLHFVGQASHRDGTSELPRSLQVAFGDVTLDMLSESCLMDIRGQMSGMEGSSDEFADEEGVDEDEDNEEEDVEEDEEDEEEEEDEGGEEGDDEEEVEGDDEEDEEGDDEDEEDDYEENSDHMEGESNAAVNMEVGRNRGGLQSFEIERLPTRAYTGRSSRSMPNYRGDFDRACQVCLERYSNGDKLRILPCFHEFHSLCIDPWLRGSSTCPICRVQVDVSGQ